MTKLLVAVDLELDPPPGTRLGLGGERELRVLAGVGPSGADPAEQAAEPAEGWADEARLALDEVDVLGVPDRGSQVRLVERGSAAEGEGRGDRAATDARVVRVGRRRPPVRNTQARLNWTISTLSAS